MKRLLISAAALIVASSAGHAKELNSIGILVASLGNPLFRGLGEWRQAEAKKINPKVKVTTVGFEQDFEQAD